MIIPKQYENCRKQLFFFFELNKLCIDSKINRKVQGRSLGSGHQKRQIQIKEKLTHHKISYMISKIPTIPTSVNYHIYNIIRYFCIINSITETLIVTVSPDSI